MYKNSKLLTAKTEMQNMIQKRLRYRLFESKIPILLKEMALKSGIGYFGILPDKH
jgi:epoxyqueuosine reductase QueG